MSEAVYVLPYGISQTSHIHHVFLAVTSVSLVWPSWQVPISVSLFPQRTRLTTHIPTGPESYP